MDSSIGGYFELELPVREEYHNNALRLNTGRNAFEYVLRAKGYKKVYLPYYTCDVMMEPIHKMKLDSEFYHIDKSFRPVFDFSSIRQEDVFVYNNYFGICDEQTREIAAQCKNLIIDNSQAFYSKPIKGVDTFYSPRKFFGLPDGAYLYTDKLLDYNLEIDISFTRFEHLLGRIDLGTEMFYGAFKRNEDALVNQSIKRMSELTRTFLSAIDYQNISEIRISNFNFLAEKLKDINLLDFKLELNLTPMIFPFLAENGAKIKKELIKHKIYIASYWPNIIKWVSKDSLEMHLYNNLICIPIDQRYYISDMNRIISLIRDYE
jgi:hypothetical protein